MSRYIFNVVHVTSWLSREGGGIPPVVWALAGAMQERQVKVSVVGLDDEWVASDCAKLPVPFKAGKVIGPHSFGFSPTLAKYFQSGAKPPGIIHSHGLWMYPGIAARKSARQSGSSLVISPHGMLEPWALNRAGSKKWLAGALFEYRNLRSAQCLHALCTAEAEHFRQLGLTNPIATIPNGMDLNTLDPLPDREALADKFPGMRGLRRVLFLARLHPKKGLDNLLRAWKNAEAVLSDWCLLIAGNGLPAYEDQLRSLVRASGLDRKVIFLGPVYGRDKLEALAAADAFVLPSFSEGFSVAILEAAATGLPVLLTRECNFPELMAEGAAIEITTEAAGIEAGLTRISRISEVERTEMGQRGRQLIERAYTWPVITSQMLEVYQWLTEGGQVPQVVQVI